MDTKTEPSCVISALQILVSPKQCDKTDLKSISSFTDILVENISIFEKIIESEQRFHHFNATWKSDGAVIILPTEPSTWRFVLYCLKCLHLLQQALSNSVGVYNRSSHPAHKPTGAPKMSPDTLSFNEQKVVKTAVQFIVCMGICPRLQSGVGIPIELRSGFSHMVERTYCMKKNSTSVNVQLFSCIKILLSCTSSPVLGTLILTQHLTDVLAVLFQLCHTESGEKLGMNKSAECPLVEGDTVLASSVFKVSIENSNPAEVVDIVRSKFDEKCKHKNEEVDASAESNENVGMENKLELLTSDERVENLMNENIADENGERHKEDLFIDIDYCKDKLEELIRKVFPPLLVKTLMLLQGGPPSKKATNVPSMQPAPKWLRQDCSKYLLSIIMRPRGVQSVMRGMLDVPGAAKGMTDTYDWRKCDAVAKVISCCPLQSVSSEMYYKSVGSQILDLIHIEDVQVCKQFLRVACSIISNMSTQHDELTRTYIIQPILRPLLICTDSSMFDVTVSEDVVVEESQLTRCIEDCQKVFVKGCGANPMLITYIQPVLLPLFDLFVFTSLGVSAMRTSCQELLSSFLKQMDTSVAISCLETMAFQQTCSEIQLPTKHQNMKFANGDSGGVIVVTDLSESKSGSYDEACVGCIVALIEDLQTTDVPGQFLVYMLQELTQFIQSEIHGDNQGDTTETSGNIGEDQVLMDIEERYQTAVSRFHRKLMLLNLLAAVCEKLGPSCIKNAHHTIDFVKATLERGVQVCKNTEDAEFEAFENETVTMAIGLVTALMTGAFEMNEQDRKYMQELLPLLEELSKYHPDASVQEMATDIRIAIATHGVVWSEITKEKCPQYKDVSEKKTTNKKEHQKSHQSKSISRKIEEIPRKEEVVKQTKDENKLRTTNDDADTLKTNVVTAEAHNKAHDNTIDKESEVSDKVAVNDEVDDSEKVTNVVHKSGNKTEALADVLMKEGGQESNPLCINGERVDDEKDIPSQQSKSDCKDMKPPTELDMAFKELCDPLVPVRGHGLIRLYRLVQKRDPVIKNKEELLLKIFEENLDHGDSYIYLSAVNGLAALCEEHASLVIPRVCEQFADYRNNIDCRKHDKSPELRMKLGEIMVKASRCLGDLLPQYRDVLLPSILTGVKDKEAFVRASSLSNLGEICKLLKFSLGNIIHEVFDCCSYTLKHDENVQVRKAAAQALTLLLQGLGSHVFKVLESVLKDLYRVLKSVMLVEKDEGVKLHAQLALNELDDLMRAYLFPEQKLEKRIRVLDFN